MTQIEAYLDKFYILILTVHEFLKNNIIFYESKTRIANFILKEKTIKKGLLSFLM